MSAYTGAHAGPLLSICIPTYNRAQYVATQVQSVIDNFLDRADIDVELVIVNNQSTDGTARLLSQFVHQKLRIVERKTHYDTAEENLMRSVEFLSGKYVWFLGDDDPLQTSSLDQVIQLLKAGQYGCYIFNSTTMHSKTFVADWSPIPMHRELVAGPIHQIIEMIGLLNTFAGISNIIQLRDNLHPEAGLQWLATSKIYSHVAWFVQSNRNEVVAFVNMPLVLYRLNDYSNGHWERTAKKFNVQSLYFWTLGIKRLVSRLVDDGLLSPSQVSCILELASGHKRYRLLDDICIKMFQQISLATSSRDSREFFSDIEFEELRSFCLRCDPTLFDLFELLRQGQEASKAEGQRSKSKSRRLSDWREKFPQLLHFRQRAGLFYNRYIGTFNCHDVFKMATCFVAVRSGSADLRESVLRYVDPIGDGRRSFVGESLEEVRLQIDEARMEELQNAGEYRGRSNPSDEDSELLLRTQEKHDATIKAIYSSTSWKITAPIRAFARLLWRRGATAKA